MCSNHYFRKFNKNIFQRYLLGERSMESFDSIMRLNVVRFGCNGEPHTQTHTYVYWNEYKEREALCAHLFVAT